MAWRLASDDLRLRSWDGLTVVYDPYSGDTHCTDQLASAILDHLAGHGASTLNDLKCVVGVLDGDEGPKGLESGSLTSALSELERLRLVRRVPE